MIELYFWPTPNGKKVSIMLEECGLPFELKPVNIGRGDQFKEDFLRISPNNRMPAMVDTDTGISVFESGAILMYLAEKSGQFKPMETAPRFEVLQWLFWQMGGLGPMAGQLSHFVNYAPDPNPYALERYKNEYDRLLGIMDTRLSDRDYLAGDYSIADMASFPWIAGYKRFGADLDQFIHLRRWFDELKSRPAVRNGMNAGEDWSRPQLTDEEARKVLFGQTAQSVAQARDVAGVVFEKMKFYDCQPAPSPRRVRIFLKEKGLEIPTVQIDLGKGEQLAKSFKSVNPDCTVPVLELEDGTCLSEILAICQYIEATQPDPCLMGRDAQEKAIVLMWNAKIEQLGLAALAETFRNRTKGMASRALTGSVNFEQIPELVERGRLRAEAFMARLDEHLSSTDFIAGDQFTLADITALVMIDFAEWSKITIKEEWGNLQRWYDVVRMRPSAGA